MSSQERLALKGRLIEKKQEQTEFEIKIKGLIRDLKRNLDPYEEIQDLKIDFCVQQVLALREAQAAYRVLQHEIHEIKKDLDED